jgi:hypothetical protein
MFLDLLHKRGKNCAPNIDANTEARVLLLKDALSISTDPVGREVGRPNNGRVVSEIAVGHQVFLGVRVNQRGIHAAAVDPRVNGDTEKTYAAAVDRRVNGNTEKTHAAAVDPRVNGDTEKTHAVAVDRREAGEKEVAVSHQDGDVAVAAEVRRQTVTGRVREQAIEDHAPDQGGWPFFSFIIFRSQHLCCIVGDFLFAFQTWW